VIPRLDHDRRLFNCESSAAARYPLRQKNREDQGITSSGMRKALRLYLLERLAAASSEQRLRVPSVPWRARPPGGGMLAGHRTRCARVIALRTPRHSLRQQLPNMFNRGSDAHRRDLCCSVVYAVGAEEEQSLSCPIDCTDVFSGK
jgi:hypothetical protein